MVGAAVSFWDAFREVSPRTREGVLLTVNRGHVAAMSKACASLRALRGIAVGAITLALTESIVRAGEVAGLEPLLPGFRPVEASDRSISPEGRRYAWEDTLLPAQLESRGRWLAGPMLLELRTAAGTRVLDASSVRVIEDGPSRARVVAEGALRDGIRVGCTTAVEYDGVAWSACRADVEDGAAISEIRLRVAVDRNPFTRLLPFKATEMRIQKGQRAASLPAYAGEYLSALALADGERSFWWFCDDRGEHFDALGSETVVAREGETIVVDQRVLGAVRGPESVAFRFGFLATPIRELGTEWRAKRVVAGAPSAKERSLGGRYFLWWPTTFAHDMLPLLQLPPETADRLDPAERALFPGIAGNRALVERDLREFGIHRLAYGSVRVASELDPRLAQNRHEWEVQPPFVFRKTHMPFRAEVEKPSFTHREPAFSEYLLDRWREAIAPLGVVGAYLDNGFPIDTLSPRHDCRSARSGYPCTDIEGTRRFLHRFRQLFLEKGRPGYLFVHVSAREIIPAYTFVTSLIDGEQYGEGLEDGDYMRLLPLDEVRTRFSPQQYGVLNTWLNLSWSYLDKDRSAWRGSESQRRSTRSFMGLALLHDVPMWMAELHPEERSAAIQALSRFGVERATFRGYWNPDAIAETTTPDAAVSAYVRDRDATSLLVIANLGSQPAVVAVQLHLDRMGARSAEGWRARSGGSGRSLEIGPDGRFHWPVAGRSFELVELLPGSSRGEDHR